MKRNTRLLLSALAITSVVLFAARYVNAASTANALLSFNGSDGSGPNASVIFDSDGNLYGTTSGGGAYGYGTVFKLVPGANGTWTETILHSFNRNGTDGANPGGALIWDSAGNLYGTASAGGADENGAVFELSPGPTGNWTEKVLFSFHGVDGSTPAGSLTFDAQGNLYGTTAEGGDRNGPECLYQGCGNVFELSPGSNGEWTESVLHNFNSIDGSTPYSNVIFDAQGNLYGTTTGAWTPPGYHGNVFELIHGSNGEWKEKILYFFSGDDDLITAGLTLDNAGNLYGTTWTGGAHAAGSVFRLSPNADGTWTESTLHSFNTKDGSFVNAGVVFDSKGNLWGTTAGYGSDLGSVYELIPNGEGQWAINVVHTFHDIEVNGGVTFDGKGNVYSTAAQGGASKNCSEGCGMVFEVAP